MKIHLIGSIYGNEHAASNFNAMEEFLRGAYQQAVIFNPLKQGFKQLAGESALSYDARCLSECIKRIAKLDSESDFAVIVDNPYKWDELSGAHAESNLCIRYEIPLWGHDDWWKDDDGNWSCQLSRYVYDMPKLKGDL